MDINLNKLGKRYRFEWIFRNMDLCIPSGSHFAIRGPNGSGKSTLLKILSGHLGPTEGKISHSFQDNNLDRDHVFRFVAFAAPYIDLIEEMTLREIVQFQQKFKAFLPGAGPPDFFEILNLNRAENKEIRYFSSGMKQRLKLALAICSDSPLLLLDEPSTNLDKQGMRWYKDLIEKYGPGRTLVVASNLEDDYSFCDQNLDIMDFKKKSLSNLSSLPGVISD